MAHHVRLTMTSGAECFGTLVAAERLQTYKIRKKYSRTCEK